MALFAFWAYLLLLASSQVCATSTAVEQAPPGTSSLTFVFDTTGSMNDDLKQVQDGARKILDTVLTQREKLIYNFVYVPFHDPGWGPVFTTTDANAFQRHLNSVHVVGGGDCPEMALSGIQLALETALPSSYIYVFTDARAKDYHLEDQIMHLVQEKQSTVVFVMTGDCNDRAHPGFRTYEKIAAVSFGQVFHLEKTDVQKVLEYVRNQLTHKKVSIMYELRERGGSNVRQIPVDSHMSHLEIALSGDRDDGDYLDISLLNPRGNKVEKDEYEHETGTLDLANIKIIRIKDPIPGIWKVRTTSRLKHTFSVNGNGSIQLNKFGFCSRPMNKIELTHEMPVAHQSTYLMVNMTGLISPGTVVEIALVDYFGKELLVKPAIVYPHVPYLYYMGPFIPPKGVFYVRVKGEDDKNYEFQRIALRSVTADQAGGPKAYMAATTHAVARESVNLTCSVASRSNFELYWYKGDTLLEGPFFYPFSDTAIWTINEVNPAQDQGQYSCRVTSPFGNHSAITTLTTTEPKPEITFIRNESVPLGRSAFLHCRTQTPHATVQWLRGNVPIMNTINTKLYPNGTLGIAETRRADGGLYCCRVRTEGGSAQATAILKVLECPKASVFPSNLYFVPGISFNVSCYTTGDPVPEVKWYLKGKALKPEAGKYYITHKNDLIVQNPTVASAGVYECRAKNPAGENTASVVANVAVAPKIKVLRERQMVNKGERVVLECVIEAGVPKPKITWYRGGKEIPSYPYIQISEGRLTIKNAQDSDGGAYTCVAQNIAGRAHGNLYIDVGSLPIIVPSPESARVNIEKSITLPCRAIGHPGPKTSWKKNDVPIESLGARYKVLPDGSLLITEAQLEDQDTYTCTAKNVFGQQTKKVALTVTGLVPPVLGQIPLEEQLIEDGELRLSCIIMLGTPKPTIQWLKDGIPVEDTDDVNVEAGGSGLHIRNGNLQHEGRYTCFALSPAGNASINVNVELIRKPTITANPQTEILVRTGDPIFIPCRVSGKPEPKVQWLYESKPFPEAATGYTVEDDHTLHIYQANINHAGVYTCVAANPAGEVTSDTGVNVLTPPVIVAGPMNFNAVKGDALSIPCEVKGQPMPKITWYLNDIEFKEGTIDEEGTLTIPSIMESQRGVYKCIAENEVGADEKLAYVTVHTPPTIPGTGKPVSVTVNVNETVKMPCPARAYPPPIREWYYGSSLLETGLTGPSEARIDEEGSLILTNVQLDRTGDYRCYVSNLAGEDFIAFELKVQEPPRIFSEIPGTFDIVRGLMLEIPCRARGTPEPTITWEKNDLQVIPDRVIDVIDGTLRIAKTESSHHGTYRCLATNPAGKDSRQTIVVVQEPPSMTHQLPAVTTTVEGETVELKCAAEGNPPPSISWVVKGVPVTEETPGIIINDDNTLVIERAKADDAGLYSCRASNFAGRDETYTQLAVITKPVIPDSDKINQESVVANQTISLYCPVYSTPLPQVTWQLENKPIAEADTNVQLSEDKRRLRILKSRVSDAGIYKCIARNKAGESWKMFNVEVLVAPHVDESKHKLKVSVMETDTIEFGCPVSGVPDPDISWLVSGDLMQQDMDRRGVMLGAGGRTIVIDRAQIGHQGIYTCVATNKAGTLDIDVQLTVLAPPKPGKDEIIEVVVNEGRTLNCDVEQEGLRFTISWLVNGSEALPANAQIVLDGRRLHLNDVELENGGDYQCRVRNIAGESKKNFKLIVLAPPQFRDLEYKDRINVTTGTTYPLSCYVTGNPKPTIKWFKDGQQVTPSPAMLADDGQVLRISHDEAANYRYTCIATNKAGTENREFVVQVIAPPSMDAENKTMYEAREGQSVTLECPVSSPFDDIEWLKEGKPVTPTNANVQLSLDRTRLVLSNLQKEDEATFTCVAKNFAGKANQEIKLAVLIPPRIIGKSVEDLEIIEGSPMELECDFEADPIPEVTWTKNNGELPHRVELVNEKHMALVDAAIADDEGTYHCAVKNKAGEVEKTFNVRIIVKPVLTGSEKVDEKEILITTSATFECPIVNPIGVELTWTKDGIPIVQGTENVQLLNGGRHLLIPNVTKADQAVYTCVASNPAGKSEKKSRLIVLIPPTISGVGGPQKVTENGTTILPCEAEGYPFPAIEWTKDGGPALDLAATQALANGQQLKIVRASTEHAGNYFCIATNKVGKAELGFVVDVITRPTLIGAREIVEVNRNDTATFKCQISDSKFTGEITWLKDFTPITIDSQKYALSQNNRKLHVARTELRDEGTYTCRVRNEAGDSKFDYKLVVLVPPQIIMLDKDKDRTVIENSTVTLSCPATGKPEPVIEWFKDGELLAADNITQKIKTARVEGNELKISRVEIGDSGRYTCEAKNKAGSVEEDVLLYVMTPPRIERQGVPTKYQIRKGGSVSISCPAFGRPPPSVTWLKSGRALEYSPDTYVSASGMKLHFLHLQKEDADRYTCIAKNAAGEDKRDFVISLQEPPTIEGPNILKHISVNKGRTAAINCPATGSPEPTIAWLINGQPLTADSRHVFLQGGRQLQISDASVTDDARYTCVASNDAGYADLDAHLIVVEPPEIAGPEFEVVEVVVNSPQDLVCEATGTENMETEWLKDGHMLEFGSVRGGDDYLQVSSRNRRLHILSAQVSHAGRFTCVVKNAADEKRKHFDLRVLVPPTINDSASSPPLQTIIPGSPFGIECKVDAIPDAKITWTKDDKVVNPDDTLIIANNDNTIWVNKASDAYQGRYTCEAKNKAGSTKRDFFIKLTDPPVVDIGRQEIAVKVGDFVTLTCKIISGTGNITVKWLIDERPVENGAFSPTVSIEERRIQIQSARLSDTGTYICTAENEAGKTQKRFDLTVQESPRFMDTSYPSPSIIVGRPLTLDCSATGTPKPEILWFKDGKPMDESDDVLFLNDNQQMHIESATEDDAGRYSCTAQNKAGTTDKDLIVAVLRPPKMSEDDRVFEVLENDTQSLECPISDPSVKIQWIKNGIPITTSANLQLSTSGHKIHIMHGQVPDSGRYTCKAWNDAGEAFSNMEVVVLVPPKIIAPSLRQLEAVLGHPAEIECKATGTPTPQITWSFDGRTLFPSEKIELLNNGSILRLLDVQENQEGRYTCTAENKVGRIEADSFLRVTAPPHIITAPDDLKVIEGQSQAVRCEAVGSPSPKVEWLKNGQPFSSPLAQSSGNLHYIHISKATVEDAGRYTCIATNRAGEHRVVIQLHVLVPPTILEGERIVQVKELTPLVLECQASGNPTPSIIWKRDGVLMESIEGPKLTVEKPTATDAGRYTCEARNEAGKTSADFEVDVFVKPRFKDLVSDVRVKEGERARLECKVEGHPTPVITWLRGGRPIEAMQNFILSPRGETLMILKAKRADAGGYSCLGKNFAGESEAQFMLTVLVEPYIEEQIDQNPRVVTNQTIVLRCPVLGIPKPTVEWQFKGEKIAGDRFSRVDEYDLQITGTLESDAGRYTCVATNEAGTKPFDFELEVIGPPKFRHEGKTEYEVVVDHTITMTCAFDAEPKPKILWFRGDNSVYLSDNIAISADGEQLTIRGAQLSNGGKYTCKASNEAGKADVDLTLKVLVPPTIDKSNIIGNPLAIAGRPIYLECPVTGIPMPTVEWFREGDPVDLSNPRLSLNENNQTFGIKDVLVSDEGRYYCVAKNKGGQTEQEFNLEVLVAPQMDSTESQKHIKREEDSLTLACPVKRSPDSGTPTQILWYKGNRPVDTSSLPHLKLSNDGRRLHFTRTTLSDAGNYSCVALNRAGEVSVYFVVEILSAPRLTGTNNEASPHVLLGRPITLWCMATGHPFPTIRWFKNGKEEESNLDNGIRILENGQGLEITEAKIEHAGIWSCEADNDAGKTDLEINLDVWTPPTVTVTPQEAVKPLENSLTLTCTATGNPTPMVTWSKDGQPLTSSVDGARISMKGTRLDIPRLQQSHVGQYSCAAHNDAGNDERTVFVDVLVPPVINRDGIDMSPRLPVTHTPTLYCEASGKPFPEVQWYFNNTLIPASTNNILIGEMGRYIQIMNISLADRGLYKCVATNVAGMDEVVYTIAIFQAPTIINGGTQQAVEGGIAKIFCDAIGEPAPLIQWQRNGMLLDSGVRYAVDDRNLIITDARSSDSGIYLCKATNEAGEAHQAFTLEVLVPPRIASMAPVESVVKVDAPFSLKCAARGYPYPEITWTLGTRVITEEMEGYNIAEDGTLFVFKAQPDIVYQLKCTARNDAGVDEMNYTVKTMSPPNVPADIKKKTINTTEGDETLFTCQVAGESARLQWLKKGQPLVMTRNMSLSPDYTNLKIHSTKLGDEGLYTCVASNFAGNATQDFQLFVGVPPRIEASSLKVEANAGDDAILECEAIGIPPPKIAWLKNEQPIKASGDQASKSTLKFSKVTNDDSAVYTCSAENWAGHAYKDINLIVFVPPKVHPERLDVTARQREDVILACNSTGIPEPIVTWLKMPNLRITGRESKYQVLGTSLAIRNVEPNDEGSYQCTAKTSAGLAKGIRNLKIGNPPATEVEKNIWVECDESGKPMTTAYVPARGDVPADDDNFLPVRQEYVQLPPNGTDGVVIRCMPPSSANRGARTLGFQQAPRILERPRSTTAQSGSAIELRCRATGTPVPIIRWQKNGRWIQTEPSANGMSTHIVRIQDQEDAGTFTCIAQNAVGSVPVQARIEYEDHQESSAMRHRTRPRNVAVFTCVEYGIPQQEFITWTIDGEEVDENDDFLHTMNNGSLVMFDVDSLSQEQLDSIHCKIRNRQRPKQYFLSTVIEDMPKVTIHMNQYYTQVGENINIDCHVRSEPLTTKVRWTKDNRPLSDDDTRIRVLPNNSLSITSLRPADRASYKCRGSNRLGKMFDEVELIVQEGPKGVVGFIGGQINNQQVRNQALFMNVTPKLEDNSVYIKVDNLLNNREPAARAMVGYASALCPMLAHNRDYEGIPKNNVKFERYTDYHFDTGEKLRVRHTGSGMNGAFLKMDVLVDGSTPRSNYRDTVTMDDFEEEMIENEPGYIQGHGRSALHIGQRTRIPFHWNHSTSYDASDGMSLGPGQTLSLKLKAQNGNDGNSYKADVIAKRKKQCPEGFEMLNGFCKDINECDKTPGICGPDANCVNEEGDYRCIRECEAGYRVKWDGSCIDIDECVLGTYDCPPGTQCMNLPGNYSCEADCAEGFFMNAKGQCEDIDECASSPCPSPMTCLNQMGSHLCICPSGLPASESGQCQGMPVETEVSAKLIEADENNNDCPEGYTWNGMQCEDIDECIFDSPCQYACRNTPGSYVCECPEGYDLEDNECIDVDECASNPCEEDQLCFNHLGSYECIAHPCPIGYRLEAMECLPECQNCSLPPIRIHLVTLPRGIRSTTSLLRLTAYDMQWRVLHNTKFTIKISTRHQRHPPFVLKENNGRAILQNTRPLLVGNKYKLGIKALSKSPYTNSRFHSEFLVFISVSQNAF